MKAGSRFGIAVFICAFAALPFARASTPTQVLTWQRCIDLAASANADLKAAQATLQSRTYSARGAYSGFFPQVTTNLGYTYGNTTSSTFTPDPTINTAGTAGASQSNRHNFTANLSVSENLFAGFGDQGQVRQANANTRAAEANLRIAKAKASYDLKSAFAGLLYARSYERLADEIIKRRETNLRLVELRYESGNENKGSVLLSQAYLQEARLNRLQASNASDVARTQLAKVLGLDDFESYGIQGDIPSQPPHAGIDFATLAAATPEHDQSVAQEDAADAAITIARSGFFPSLNLTGTISRQGQEFELPTGAQGQRWTVGVGISFPLFNGGKDYYGTRSAGASYTAAVSNRVSVDRQRLLALRQNYTSFVESVERLKVDETYAKAAQVRAEVARNKYNNGLLSFENWDQIENDLIQREKNAISSRRDRVTAEAAWEQALGKGVIP